MYSAGISFQNLVGLGFQIELGGLRHLSKGNFWAVMGNGSTGVSGIPPGNNLRLRLLGMLAQEHLYTPLGNIEIFWGYPTSLRLTVD